MNGKSLFEIIRLITRVPNSVHAFYVTVNAGIGGLIPLPRRRCISVVYIYVYLFWTGLIEWS